MLLRTGQLEAAAGPNTNGATASPSLGLSPSPAGMAIPSATARLLLHADQGLGDSIHFIRYAPLIAATGGRVLLRCQRQLLRLLKNFPGIEQTCSEDDPLPSFDVHCPLISLPVAFKTRLETIPSICPYLRPNPTLVRLRPAISIKHPPTPVPTPALTPDLRYSQDPDRTWIKTLPAQRLASSGPAIHLTPTTAIVPPPSIPSHRSATPATSPSTACRSAPPLPKPAHRQPA